MQVDDVIVESLKKQKKYLQNQISIIEEQEKALRKQFDMYEDAGCYKCGSEGYTLENVSGNPYISTYARTRCKCSKVFTVQYKNFLKNSYNMLVKDFNIMKDKFYDNNKYCDDKKPDMDRSW